MAFQLFRSLPSQHVVQKVLNAFDIEDVRDAVPFTRADVLKRDTCRRLESISELHDLYLPCKRSYVAPPLTVSRSLTVLRHMLRSINATLKPAETYICGQKIVVYRICIEGGHSGLMHVVSGSRDVF